MGCVNKSSKEFKDLASRHNLDTNALELIVHKYWLETGNETLFPTDVYIQSQLGNAFYQEDGKNVREIWKRHYSSTKEFPTLQGVQSAFKEASRYFPKSAIYYYKNAKGNFMLSVKKPAKKIKKDKEKFFYKLDNMMPTSEEKTLDLNIKENQAYDINKIEELYNRFNIDRTSKDLADRIFNVAKNLGLNIVFNNVLPDSTIGRYTNDNSIIYKKSFFENDAMNNLKAPILLHEVLHAVSMYALSDSINDNELSAPLRNFKVEMNSLYQDLKTNPMLKGERGILNLNEFVAELGNPVFRGKIQEIDKVNKASKSFWSRVLDAFKKLLGLHTSNSYYERSMNALDKALGAFDIDIYMRYNNLKSMLREGYNSQKWDYETSERNKLKEEVDNYFDNKAIKNNDLRLEDKNNQYEQGLKAAGRTFEGAFNFLKNEQRRMGKGSKTKTSNNQSLREQLHEESSKQQKELINWATKNNKLIVEPIDYYEEELGNYVEGSEAKVWKNGNTVVKNITLNHYSTPFALLNRILIHNVAFPASAMKLSQIGISDNGLSVVVEQPYIEDSGIAPIMEEIENYMVDTLGFTLSKGKGINAEYSKDGYIVSDIRPENVIKQPDGTLAVIDCFAQFKDESLSLGLDTPSNFIKSLTSRDLRNELSLIKQESADYNLVNDVEEGHKKSSKAVPQDFTFNDGTTVKAPFRPNEQQVAALNAMSDFIKSNETSMTLSGYAGTGKTSLMEMIAKKCQKQHKPVIFCATTNKATAVLNDRVSKANFKATTLNKTFGINVEVDPNSSSYNARNLVNNLKNVDIMPGTTVIIDEASMINEENYGILNKIAKDFSLKIIYVGDQAQLAPVNEDQISKVFRNGDGKVITLTQVERTDDNAILKEATAIRNGEPLSGDTSFNSKGEGVAYISPTHQDAIDEVISHYVEGLKENPNHFRILAYTNKAVTSYNDKVRKLLGYDSPIPHKGEPMTGYANWGYDWKKKTYRFINSESYKVTEVGKSYPKKFLMDDGRQIPLEVTPITLEDSLGHRDQFEFMDIKGNTQNRQAAMILANEKKNLWAKARQVYGRQAKAEIYTKINFIDSFLFVNDNIEDNNHNLLQAKTIDFGYAMTVHKSQGSTFANVLMDDVDISRANMKGSNEGIEVNGDIDYSKVEVTSSEDVDLGSLDNIKVEEKNPNQAANVKQQLEYVGVSRATDTVTIISNHIKKEGSPLHPEKNIKEDKINDDNSRSTNNNNNVNNGTEYKQTDEFRKVQEAVRKGSQGQQRSVLGRNIPRNRRQDLANVLGRELGSIDSFIHGSSRNVVNDKHNTTFNLHSDVNPKLFHDIFEVVRYYTENGELVDLHDDYSDCKCFLTEDGTAGFAIEPDGNLISVFNLGTTKGFLRSIKDVIREAGATHLEAYASSLQNLEHLYRMTIGFHTASSMDYNMEYDHDDIAKNHGNPNIVFMVAPEVESPKHFDKDSYDKAKEYQMQQLKEESDTPDTSTLEEGQSFAVDLPGYRQLNNLYSNVPVDATWKVPYLRELDAQLTGGHTEEENQNILNQMDNVLQATSEKDYRQELEKSKENKVDKQLDEYDKFVQQLDNLMEGGNEDYKELGCTIKATEIRHTAELIVNEISDEITRLQKEKGRAEKIFPDLNTNLDFQTATRKQIVEAVNINRLIDRVKNMFDSENADYDDLDVSMQADLITDNWGAFMTLAQDLFVFNEGFGLTRDYSNGSFKTSEATKADVDNFNNYSNDPDVAAEQGEKDEQEKWQIDSRTVDPLTSMSALVRQGLHECYLLDENGNKVMSKWGIAERVDPREALNSILRWTQGCLSLDDMIAKLSEKQPSSPWLQQLINRLSDKSGKETDFQSQFYGVFSKDFQPYSIVLLEDGKYHVMPVNSHPALSEAMKSISAKFRIGEHSLFGLNGSISSKDLGSEETVNSSKPNLHKSYAKLNEIVASLKKGKELDDTMAKEATDSIIDACNILGFDGVTDTMLTDVINKENIKKEAEYLGYIVKDLDKALAAQKKGELKEFNPFKYGVKYGIDGSLRNFLTPITDKMEDTAVNAFYDSGKMYQSYVTPSFMTKLMKKFKQEGQKLEDFLMDEYACSEWFAYNKTSELNMVQWRNEWLRLLARDENARKVFDHHVELNFNKHNYMRNMTDAEYTISLITEYFGESTKQNDMTPAWFRIPMLSNKPSSEFIKFYSYRGMNYKDSIVRGLHSMFLQELSRIQTVRMRNHSKNDPEFIKNFDSNGRKFNFLPVFNAYMEDNIANKAKRELLHNTVEYDTERLDELQRKEDAYKKAYSNSSVNADGSVNFSVNEDLKNMQLTQEEQAELNALKARKEASDRALTSEEDDRFASFLQKKIKGEIALTDEEEVEFGKLADKIIRQFMENRVQSILDNWEENGILESAKSIKNIYPSELDDEQAYKWVREQVENFLWNDAFASKNILQLTIGDIAFYKDTEDLQKRLAQLHAPGMRGRIDAVDYDGNRVSDGKYRTFILKDFDSFKSNIIANISEVFDRKIAAASEDEKPQWRALKESLVGEKGKYTRINVTDAQGYSSPSSYRKKAYIFGRWSHDAENTYKKILDGNYTLTDFETAFQPLKPFVYSRLTKNMGVEGAPIQTMRVPFQAKNAEYLLIMADAILQGEKLSKPNLLRAVYRVMEDSEKINPTMGIDTVQFESAIKSGLQNPIDIFQFRDMEGGEDAAYTYMMNQIYKKQEDAEGNRIYKDYDIDTSVHETSYEDYCLQQEVPAHFKEHSQAHGSQIRMITPSDLDLYTTDENGNQVDNYYTWKESDGTVRKVKADEFRKEYERTIAENIEESIINLSKELHLEGTKKERNLALSKILLKEISSSPRYGIDLALACQVDKETGDFRIPKGDPIQAKRIEQLINSIIKNRVNKQKIAGGPIVQVSNFGTSKQLHIRFNDRQGNLMPLEEEYNPSEHDNLSYKDYCKKNQGGIAYFEVFCPMWSDEIYQKFANQDGTINVDAINAMDLEFLKMVSYRIPTEDKYSCAPMKVVGFMPREAGDAIMFPYELTEIDDSDFDVDKRYVMRKSIPIKRKPRKDIEDALFEKATKRYAEMTKGGTRNVDIGNEVRMFMDNPERMRNNSKFMGWLYKQYQSIAYKTDAPTSGKDYRDNKIIDMTYAVLTNEMTADKILNPGGFDAPKKIAYKITAYKRLANEGYKWEDLQNMDTDELKAVSYQDKDLTFADTQVQFYKQNAAAASLIGVFAVNKVAHAVLEGNDIYLDVLNNLTKKPFVIGDNVFGGKKIKDENGKDMIIIDNSLQGKMLIDGKYDRNGTLIGKTLGSLVSASADAVKDPILNLINVNMTTAGMLNTILRLGMPFDDAAMFLSQDIIERLLSQFNRENLTNSVSLDSLINKWLDNYRKMQGLTEDSKINSEGLTMDELIEGLTPNEHSAIDYKVLLAFQRLKELTDFMRKPTFATRFNSISSAVGPLIIDNLIIEHRIEGFKDTNMNGGTPFSTYDNYVNDWMPVDIDDIFTDHPILKQFSRTVDLAKDMLSDMPANSPQFRSMLGIGIEKDDRNEENIDILPSDIAEKMFDDKKLLDQFSNFYQSYLLIQSGLVNPSHLRDYATGFPKWFMEQKFTEKYPDNALIKAIRMNIAKNTGRPYLQINITGMDEQQKEELRYAWIDLHKEDPELSKMLFDYSFFRAGIGFSPKTFMALVPSYVKERLKSKDESTSYVDTFRKLPTVVPHLVIDQFIRNNWNNNKLIPWRGGENTHYNIDIKYDRLTVCRPEDRADVENVTYIKTKAKDVVYLWHKVMSDDNGIVFERVKPLGNNGEYLEISLNDIKTPLVETLRTSEDNETSDLEETSFQDTSAEETSEPIKSETQEIKSFSELADLIQKQVPTLDKEGAMKRIKTIQEYGPRMFKGFLQNVFKQKGLNLNEEEAINEYNKYC